MQAELLIRKTPLLDKRKNSNETMNYSKRKILKQNLLFEKIPFNKSGKAP